jgi:putative ABC transport system permease protein
LLLSLSLFLFLTTLSNLYPAMIMSGYRPSVILRGNYGNSDKGVLLRKSLVVAQYTVSIVIVLMTFAAYQQMDSLLHRDLGFESDQLLVVKAPRTKTERYASQYDFFKNQIISQSSVDAFSTSTFIPGYENVGYRSMQSRHMDQSAITRFHRVDYDIINTMGFTLLAGRDFDPARPADRSAVIITASSLPIFGFETPEEAIGERLTWANNVDENVASPIIAVIDDYQQNIKSNEKVPKVFAFLRGYESPWNDEYFVLNLSTNNDVSEVSSTLDNVASLWQEQFPEDPFDYFFLDDHFNRVIANEITTAKLMASFGVIAILIANLGLLGMIIFTINQRMREISIRKVLGAPMIVIARLINQESLILVALASAIAIPCSIVTIAQWMDNYEVQASLPVWAYFMPTLIIIVLGALVSAHQTIRAAMTNPIKFLKNE